MYALESNVPLSRSMVWPLQRTFYADQGIAAWTQSRVPQSVTTSPNIAGAYARIALGFVRDMHAVLDPSQPVYLVELGAVWPLWLPVSQSLHPPAAGPARRASVVRVRHDRRLANRPPVLA